MGAPGDEPRGLRDRRRAPLMVVGVFLAVAALVIVLVPIRRVESVSRTMTAPSASPAASASPGPTRLEREVRTENVLPDAFVAVLLAGALACIGAGAFALEVQEVSFGGVKLTARTVAQKTLEKARKDGLVQGDTVPTETVEQIVHEAAVAAAGLEQRLLRGDRPIAVRGGGGVPRRWAQASVSRRLLDQLADEEVEAASDAREEAARDES